MDLDFTITDEWVGLSKQEQQQHLFLKQKGILDTFLARRVISQEKTASAVWLKRFLHTYASKKK